TGFLRRAIAGRAAILRPVGGGREWQKQEQKGKESKKFHDIPAVLKGRIVRHFGRFYSPCRWRSSQKGRGTRYYRTRLFWSERWGSNGRVIIWVILLGVLCLPPSCLIISLITTRPDSVIRCGRFVGVYALDPFAV